MSLSLEALTNPSFRSQLGAEWEWDQDPETVRTWEEIILGDAPLGTARRVEFFSDIYFSDALTVQDKYPHFFQLVVKEAELFASAVGPSHSNKKPGKIRRSQIPLVQQFWLQVYGLVPQYFSFGGRQKAIGYGFEEASSAYSQTELFSRLTFPEIAIHEIDELILATWGQSFVKVLSVRSKDWASEHIRAQILSLRSDGPFAAFEASTNKEFNARETHCWCPSCKARGYSNRLTQRENKQCSACKGLICPHGMCHQNCDFPLSNSS